MHAAVRLSVSLPVYFSVCLSVTDMLCQNGLLSSSVLTNAQPVVLTFRGHNHSLRTLLAAQLQIADEKSPSFVKYDNYSVTLQYRNIVEHDTLVRNQIATLCPNDTIRYGTAYLRAPKSWQMDSLVRRTKPNKKGKEGTKNN